MCAGIVRIIYNKKKSINLKFMINFNMLEQLKKCKP